VVKSSKFGLSGVFGCPRILPPTHRVGFLFSQTHEYHGYRLSLLTPPSQHFEIVFCSHTLYRFISSVLKTTTAELGSLCVKLCISKLVNVVTKSALPSGRPFRASMVWIAVACRQPIPNATQYLSFSRINRGIMEPPNYSLRA
jgi:hypothetical protein